MEQMGMQGEQGNYLGPPGWSNQVRHTPH
jgi:hypothetical protein